MVNNIPVGWCNKAGGSRGLSLARQTQSAEVNGAEQKMSTQGAVPVFFPENVIRNVNFCFSVSLSEEKFFRRPFRSTTDTISDSISKKLHCHWQNKVELCRPDKSLGRLGWRCWLSEKKRNTTQPC